MVIAIVFAFISMCLAGAILHGALRPLLEARGVAPWTLIDSVTSSPLILIGSAGIGAGSGLGAQMISQIVSDQVFNMDPVITVSTETLVIALAIAGTSTVLLVLGILALRKLT